MIATIPVVLAAVTVWIVRDALLRDERRPRLAPQTVSSPAPAPPIAP
jgi:hypothetical protein